MKRLPTFLALAAIWLNSSAFAGEALEPQEYAKKAKESLDKAAVWLIEDGVKTHSQLGKAGIHRKLVDDFAVLLWTDPWIESERYIDAFWIKARGINYEVVNFHRSTRPSGIYEFWVVKMDGKDWSGFSRDTVFYVTKAGDIFEKREVLLQSDTFIAEYSIDEGVVIQFPIDDPQVLYELQAWRYPESYAGSEIANVKAIMNAHGQIELKR